MARPHKNILGSPSHAEDTFTQEPCDPMQCAEYVEANKGTDLTQNTHKHKHTFYEENLDVCTL